MKIIKRHKRCPHCNDMHTRKHGLLHHKRTIPDHSKVPVQRWYCYTCNRAFTETRSVHRFSYALKAARHYFVGRSSYRNIARQLHINHMTAHTHIQAVCQRAKFPWELSQELKPKWSGYLLIDSDQIIVNSRPEFVLIAVDAHTRDIPNAIVTKQQDINAWTTLLKPLEKLNYPFKAIISDGFSSILGTVKQIHPHLPHQLCIKHFEDEVYRFFRYRPHRAHISSSRAEHFMKQLHSILFATSLGHYHGELNHLLNDPKLNHPDFKDIITRLQFSYKYLTPHLIDLNIPRTTNIIENVISQLDLKLNPMIKFGSHESACNTIKCLISWYRFKKFSNCRKNYKHHNGKAPLELAGVLLKKTHWIYQAIRQF